MAQDRDNGNGRPYGDNEMHCSFCGKSRSQVSKLIQGPGGVYICDECVRACSQMIEEADGTAAEPSASSIIWEHAWTHSSQM